MCNLSTGTLLYSLIFHVEKRIPCVVVFPPEVLQFILTFEVKSHQLAATQRIVRLLLMFTTSPPLSFHVGKRMKCNLMVLFIVLDVGLTVTSNNTTVLTDHGKKI